MISAMVITLRAAQASPMTAAACALVPALDTITTRSAVATSSTSALVRPARSLSQACIDQLSPLRGAPSNLIEVKNRPGFQPCFPNPLATRLLAAIDPAHLAHPRLEMG